MRRLVTLALASASMFAMTAGDAAAAGKNPFTSCGMGGMISSGTQELGGLGRYFHNLPGYQGIGKDVIQPWHAEVKEECNFDFGGV